MKKIIYFSSFSLIILLAACSSNETNSEEVNESSTEQPDDTEDNSSELDEQEEMSRKKELLTSLIGDHSLTSIDGLLGANTMVEYGIVEGLWSASGSSNIGGTREGYDIDLTKEDLSKLKSMKISVSKDLVVTFSCNGKKYFSVPFKEDGMQFELKGAVEDLYSAIPEGLLATTTFIKSDLYLYAKDQVASSDISGVDIIEAGADAILLSYDESAKAFQLSLFYGDCCDNGIYTFN